ncbi:hypothetical protein SHELI_v1c01950 [Spiroplasma helicoides]|uniref:Uncharacterized protein n=1 Tax=Spiroplasma helicoides TaxID=216938 RepID=A0A1B3SJQ2_9MOLU|nr:hypothetical protein SHELI_v1c01950 [Spiroplasma helicoides]
MGPVFYLVTGLAIFFIVVPGFLWVAVTFYCKSKRKVIHNINWIMFGIQMLGILIGVLLIIFGHKIV